LVLYYFAVLNFLYATFALFGLRMVARYARELSELSLKDLLEREAYLPVSILVPTYNEERTIAASVRSFLALRYPEFEVIVVCDGPRDRTLEVLKEAFRLVRVDWVFKRALPTKPIRGVYRSLTYPNLLVVDKENGGKADALNAGLNFARYPLFCGVDADSLLDPEALLRASRLFLEDERVLAVGGTIRPLNGARVREGIVEELRLPRGFLEKMQIIEYARAFFMGRAGWSAMNALLIISGAFGLFRRSEAIKVGGYRTDTVGEDIGAGGPPPPEGAGRGAGLPGPLYPGSHLLHGGPRRLGHLEAAAEPLAPGPLGGALAPPGHALQPQVRPPGPFGHALLLPL